MRAIAKKAYTILIPYWHPAKTRDWIGRHWAVKHRMREEQTDFIAWYASLNRVPKATGKRSVRLKLWGWHGAKFPDRDAWDKLLLDALKQAKLIVDDSPKWLEGRVEVEYTRSRERKTVIELREVDDD